jgi:hypothetical protein
MYMRCSAGSAVTAIWLALLLGCSHGSFDSIKVIRTHAALTSNYMLRDGLDLCCSILEQHSLDNTAVQQFRDQLLQVLQQDCCDYFTALPLVKGLTDSLHEVLDLQLPLQLLPVVRRSYVSAMWLLQRSKLFKWNSNYMSRALGQGLYR